jgi:Ser/Thr protein kinase RdoA (MazF antagonist)
MNPSVLQAYGLNVDAETKPFGSGLINSTWKITTAEGEYILQRINDKVFKNPRAIAANISVVSAYLKKLYPEYYFLAPLACFDGSEMFCLQNEGCFRLFPFVAFSHSKDVAQNDGQAFEAASQFGRFTKLLSGFPISKLQITIPHFHDLELRYRQFLLALKNGNKARIIETALLIKFLLANDDIVSDFKNIKSNPQFKLRVTHHDTKISNVLFNLNDKGICVIDLDTIMPGYFISDVGDMLRTYLSPLNEEEKNFDKILIREDFYKAIVQGYLNEMKEELTETEKKYFFYAGKFMIYMQALRFITDYLSNDIYYGSKYKGQNLVRANNQIVLLQKFIEKISALQ